MSSQLLNPVQLEAFIARSPAWSLRNGALTREWSFPDFQEAMLFVNRVASLAERAHHHPDIDIRYDRVTLALVSHDAGGITARDTALALECDGIAAV
jgi:4a-hydroxytetrahydrobiopterin dehydratase